MDITQRILIQHHQIRLPQSSGESDLDKQILATIMSNITYYGFALSIKALASLRHCRTTDVEVWWGQVEPVFKYFCGNNKSMGEFVVYKNFPGEVLAMDEFDYWARQILMYWGLPNEYFSQTPLPREPVNEKRNLKVLHQATEKSLDQIHLSLLQLPARWTDEQYEDVLYLYQNAPLADPLKYLIFKENMVKLMEYFLQQNLRVQVDSATDVLRLAVAMSDGDVSLRKPGKFKRFPRRQRKFLLSLLQTCGHLQEDVFRRVNLWKVFLHSLHPGDYRARYPGVCEAYDNLYNHKRPETFNSQLESWFKNKDNRAVALLQSRPGDFMRRLRHSLQLFGTDATQAFSAVLPKLSTSQLLKIQSYLEYVNLRMYRTIAPRGNWTKMQILPTDSLPELNPELVKPLLSDIAKQISENVREYVPMVNLCQNTKRIKLQDNDSELCPYGRGTVFPIPDHVNFIRTSSYWESGITSSNIWYDNGWNFFSSEWKSMGVCCWDHPQLGNAAVFSGDPTNTKDIKGRACQLIDLYLNELSAIGVRYALWSILCYSKISFNEAKEVYAALQWGDQPEKGNLFDPSRCQLSFPLAGENYSKYIALIDIKKHELTFMDANLYAKVSSAQQNSQRLQSIMPAFSEYLETRPSVFDLFKHLPQHEKGVPIVYSDSTLQCNGRKAYVFRPENKDNQFDPLDINEILR